MKPSLLGPLFILLLMIIVPNVQAEERTFTVKVPVYKEHLIPVDVVDEELSIQKARCYFNKREGDRWLKAMWMRESSQEGQWTIVIGDDGASYGPFQIRVPTVRMIGVYYPDLLLPYTKTKKDGTVVTIPYTDADIAYRLLFDFDFSADIAGRYLGQLEKRFQVWSSAIEAYNRGAGGVTKGKMLGVPYYTKVFRHYKKETSVPYNHEICKEVKSKL